MSALLVLLFCSLLFVGGHSDSAQLEFTLTTSGDCTVGVPIVTLWIEFMGGSVDYLMSFNSTVANNGTGHTLSFNYPNRAQFYFHFIDCNHSSISCIVSIYNAKILTSQSSVQVAFCRKNLTQLSSHQVQSTDNDGMLVTKICESIGPICSESSGIMECCLPTTISPSISSTMLLSLNPVTSSDFLISSSSETMLLPSATTLFSDTSISSSSMLTPTPTSLLYCPEVNQWQKTAAGETVISTCHRGIFTASRFCHPNGEWSNPICNSTERFKDILLMISTSAFNALQVLSTQLDVFSPNETAVLLDIMITEGTKNDTVSDTQFIQIVLEIAKSVIQSLSSADQENKVSIVSQLLLTLDTFALNLRQTISFSLGNSILLDVKHLRNFTGDTLKAIKHENNKLTLPSEILTNLPITIASFVYSDLSVLSPSDGRTLISPVVSSSLDCNGTCSTSNLTQPVTISFNLSAHTQETLTNDAISCVFWKFIHSNYSLPSGQWDDEGCNVSSVDQNTVTCQCNHLTHFAILLSPGGGGTPPESIHTKILTIIGQVLIPISLVCMVLVILTYTCLKSLWSMRNYIHVMLCCNFFVSQLLFLVGVEQTSNLSICSAIAVVLQYMFLVTFMWMLMEGVVLYVSLVKVFIKHPKHYIAAFTIISYGVPALYMIFIVPIGFLVNTTDHSHYLYYNSDELVACWLSYESGFIWSFIAPVILIIIVNIGFFIMCIVIMKRHQQKQIHRKKLLQTRYWMKASLSLTIVMGIGWIVNILFFSQHLLFVAYIMTVFIASQGIIIFILYVPLSSHVREAYLKCWRKKQANSTLLSKIGFLSTNDTINKGKTSTLDKVYGHYTLGTYGGDDLETIDSKKDISPSPSSTLSIVHNRI